MVAGIQAVVTHDRYLHDIAIGIIPLYYTTPSILWTLSDDHYYGAIKGCLFALHKNPTGASGGERNHKATKHIHSRSRAWLGKHNIKTRTAILFNLKQLDRQIATTRDRVDAWLSGPIPVHNLYKKIHLP